ncbi:MAG: dienelactone hydrolase family protein [Pseudomonadota bacterium]
MTSRTEQIDAGNGQRFDAYVSIPANPNGHAVIVLQEIFGVTPQVRGVADRFAEDGYLAYAPDLFWRDEPGLSLTHSKDDMARAFALLNKFDVDKSMEDIARTAAFIRALPGFAGKVAAAGMCLGGKLAYLAAARIEVDAAVAFYGVGIEKDLADAERLHCPLMLHFGDLDKYAPEEARAQISKALEGKPDVVSHLYAGADHGFYTRGAPETIQLARARTNQFLQDMLGAVAA